MEPYRDFHRTEVPWKPIPQAQWAAPATYGACWGNIPAPAVCWALLSAAGDSACCWEVKGGIDVFSNHDPICWKPIDCSHCTGHTWASAGLLKEVLYLRDGIIILLIENFQSKAFFLWEIELSTEITFPLLYEEENWHFPSQLERSRGKWHLQLCLFLALS